MDRITPGVLALIVGAVLAVALFVPFVALSYRRRGGLTPGRTLAWFGMLLAALGMWAYTLLPAPATGSYACVSAELNPARALLDVLDPANGGIRPGNPAIQQLVLNVALFVPFGFLLRALTRRGVVVAALAGFGASLLIEQLTQLTGVWFAYPCAYRLFDTGDLVVNTLGAVLGSLLGAAVFRHPAHRPTDPHAVTAPRRLLGMLCDALLATGAAVVTGIAWNAFQLYALGVPGGSLDTATGSVLGAAVALLGHAIILLFTGSTAGEHLVLLRGRDGRHPVLVWRTVRLLTGIGGWVVLGAMPGAGALLAPALVVASIVAVIVMPDRRGLAAALAGMRLEAAPATSDPVVR